MAEEHLAKRFMKRDHHAEDGSTPRRNRLHSVTADEPLDPAGELTDMIRLATEQCGLKDGDEFEICITPTGKRPHGDRWYLFPKNRPETDDEILRRIEGVSTEESNRTALGTKLEGGADGDEE